MSCNEDLNRNLLQGSKFKLMFDRLPDVSFFCTEAVIPGMTLSENSRTTPFIDYSIAGDKITYAPLEITFLINENLSPWREVHDWVRGLGFPTTFDEYKNLPNLQKEIMRAQLSSQLASPQYSDGVLSLYTNKNNLSISISFKDLYPVELSSINLATKMTADDIISGTAKFAFTHYDLKIL